VSFFFLFLFAILGLELRGFTLSTLPALFDGFLQDRVSQTIASVVWLFASWVARITGVSHQRLAYLCLWIYSVCIIHSVSVGLAFQPVYLCPLGYLEYSLLIKSWSGCSYAANSFCSPMSLLFSLLLYFMLNMFSWAIVIYLLIFLLSFGISH
jgi:hypothetical protein